MGTGWGAASASGSSSASLSSPQDSYNDGTHEIYLVNSGGGWNKPDGSGINVIGGLGGVGIYNYGREGVASYTISVQNAVGSESMTPLNGLIYTPYQPQTSNFSPPGMFGWDGGQWYWNDVAGWDTSTHSFDHTVTVNVTFEDGFKITLYLNNKIEAPHFVLNPQTHLPEYTGVQQPTKFLQASNGVDYLSGDTAQNPGTYFNATVTTTTIFHNLGRFPVGNFFFLNTVVPNDTATINSSTQLAILPPSKGLVPPTTIPMLNNDSQTMIFAYKSPVVSGGQQGTLPQVGFPPGDPAPVSPKMVDSNPGLEIWPSFTSDYANNSGPVLTAYNMNDTFQTYVMYEQESGIMYSIGYIDWSIGGLITFKGGQGLPHTSAYYTSTSDWTTADLSPAGPNPLALQGVAQLAAPPWYEYANAYLLIQPT